MNVLESAQALQELAQRLEGRNFYAVIGDALKLTEAELELLEALSQSDGLNPREIRVRCPAVWGLSGVANSLNRKLTRADLGLAVIVCDIQRRGQGQVTSTWRLVNQRDTAA